MEQQQTSNEQHIQTLEKLMQQIDGLKLANPESKARLEEALKAAVEALRDGDPNKAEQQATTTSGGLDLSGDPATDHLLRMSQGRPSASEERKQDAVSYLSSLVNGQRQNHDDSGPAGELARMVKQYD